MTIKRIERLVAKAEIKGKWSEKLLTTCLRLAADAYSTRGPDSKKMVVDGKQHESEDSDDAREAWERSIGISPEVVVRARAMREYLLGPRKEPFVNKLK